MSFFPPSGRRRCNPPSAVADCRPPATASRLFWLFLLSISFFGISRVRGAERFPETGLAPAVDFWEDIFTRYGRNQILIHDARRVEIVWELLEVEGNYETDAGSARAQKELVKEALRDWENRLSGIAEALRNGTRLLPDDQKLVEGVSNKLGRTVQYQDFQSFSEQLHVQRGIRERFAQGWVLAGRYLSHMSVIFAEEGVPLEILALPLFESSFVLSSKSGKGAVGVWQFMRATGRMYFPQVNKQVDYRVDPILATRGAARYLNDAYRQLGSWPLAVMSYNHGVGGISRAKDAFGDDHVQIMQHYASDLFGFASRNYYPEFLAALRILRSPADYFSPEVVQEPPWLFQTVVLPERTPVKTVLDRFGIDGDTLREYNPAILSHSEKTVLPASFLLKLPPNAKAAKLEGRPEPPPTVASAGARTGKTSPADGKPSAPVQPSLTRANLSPQTASPPAPAPAKPALSAPAPPPVGSVKKPTSRTHLVQAGETVYRISRLYGVTPEQIRHWNKLRNNTIQVGQKLIVAPNK